MRGLLVCKKLEAVRGSAAGGGGEADSQIAAGFLKGEEPGGRGVEESPVPYQMVKDPQAVLERLVTDKRAFDANANERPATGTISLVEADYIRELIIENNFSACLETGVAYGASTVAICSALSVLERAGGDVRHYGVDPCQTAIYGGAAVAALRECGLEQIFELCEGPSHLMLPRLIERNVTVDFVLIDGMHTFDYTLLDLFFADKLLRPGGVLCMHDMQLPSKKKAARYLMKYRKYVRLRGPRKAFSARAGFAVKEALRRELRSAWASLTTDEPMLTARKIANDEPPWDFYTRI